MCGRMQNRERQGGTYERRKRSLGEKILLAKFHDEIGSNKLISTPSSSDVAWRKSFAQSRVSIQLYPAEFGLRARQGKAEFPWRGSGSVALTGHFEGEMDLGRCDCIEG